MQDSHRIQLQLQVMLSLAILLMTTGIVAKVLSGNLTVNEVRLFGIFHPGLGLGDRIMAIGVLVLALTPIFRVITLALLWFRSRDWKFFGVAVTVMVVLAVAVMMGGG